MIVTVAVDKLNEVMELASRFVSKHSTLPVLENVYIKGNIDTLIFRATDMEKYIDIEVPATIENEGAITVNAKTFSDIIKTLNDKEVKLSIDESNDSLNIKTDTDDFDIKGIPSNEYVAVPETSSDTNVNINANLFSKGVDKVSSAVTERSFSPVLTGVLMRMKKEENSKKLVFVGTDSFRLAEYKVDFEGEFSEGKDIIVPKVNIGDIKKVVDYYIDKGGDELEVGFSDNLVSFSFNLDDIKIVTTSILIQGDFPDYENENIMPTDFSTQAIIDQTSMDNAIKKISILTKDMNNFIDIHIDEGNILVKSGETDKGQAETKMTGAVDGEGIDIGVNGRYISDFIRAMGGSKIHMNIVNAEKPIVLTDEDDSNYRYVVRPLVK